MRVVVPTSRYKIFPIWIYTDVLEHAVLHTAVSTQTSDICDVSTWVLWKQCQKLRVSVHFAYTHPLMDTTCRWCHGSYAEKVKIYERVGLARPRV